MTKKTKISFKEVKIMQEFLSSVIGKKVDIICSGAASVRGEITKIEGGVAQVKYEDKTCYVAIDKIAIVWEVNDSESRAGFISSLVNKD